MKIMMAIIAAVAAFNSFALYVNLETDIIYERADLSLFETVQFVTNRNISNADFTRIEIYDKNLQPIGFSYDIFLNGQCDCAMVVNINGNYEVVEYYSNRKSPFSDITGAPIYLTPMCYIEYIHGKFYDIESGIEICGDKILLMCKRGFGYGEYSGMGESGSTVSETIKYDKRIVDEFRIPSGLPNYSNNNDILSNVCANQAGAVIIGYYGRYYPQLTPGFTVGVQLPSSYIYIKQNSVIQNIINDLYVYMETNNGVSGTTVSGFKRGMTYYIQSKGLNISYNNLCQNNILNYDEYKSQIVDLKPVALFFNTYNAINSSDIIENDAAGQDVITKYIYNELHVMVGYGYKKIDYYKGSSIIRNDIYLNVYIGNSQFSAGFVKLYDNSILTEAFSVNVY